MSTELSQRSDRFPNAQEMTSTICRKKCTGFILFLGLLCLAAAETVPRSKGIFRTRRTAIPKFEIVPAHWSRQHKRSQDDSTQSNNSQITASYYKGSLDPPKDVLFGKNTPVYFAWLYNGTKASFEPASNVEKMPKFRKKRSTLMMKRSASGEQSASDMVGSEGSFVKPLANHARDAYLQPKLNSRTDYVVKPKREESLKKLDPSKCEETVPETIYPEITVFADYATFVRHGKNVNRIMIYMRAFWNGVDLRFKSLECPKVRLHIARIIIERDSGAFPFISNHLQPNNTLDIQESLPSFSDYFMTIPFWENVPDIAFAMSPHTMYGSQYSKDDNSLAGLSYYGQACSVDKVGIFQDEGGFDGIDTAAHELAHLLGVHHDEDLGDEIDGYMMAPSTSFGNHSRDWSPASLEAFKNFYKPLDGSKPLCLLNKPYIPHPLPRVLPGTLMTMDQQCYAKYKTNACPVEQSLVCYVLSCKNPDPTSDSCFYSHTPADGSECELNNRISRDLGICIDGKCMPPEGTYEDME